MNAAATAMDAAGLARSSSQSRKGRTRPRRYGGHVRWARAGRSRTQRRLGMIRAGEVVSAMPCGVRAMVRHA